MKKKRTYIYRKLLNTPEAHKIVPVGHKKFMGRLFCEHEIYFLVQEEVGVPKSENGDMVAYVCTRCGKVFGKPELWEVDKDGDSYTS